MNTRFNIEVYALIISSSKINIGTANINIK